LFVGAFTALNWLSSLALFFRDGRNFLVSFVVVYIISVIVLWTPERLQ
jgi:hypothetical protein